MSSRRNSVIGALIRRTAIASAIVAATQSQAEDIDLFLGVDATGDIPNVLLVLDNSANWSSSLDVPNCYFKENGEPTEDGPVFSNPGQEQQTKMGIEKCALHNVIDALPVNEDGTARYNVGLMLLNEPKNDGAYPRHAILPLTAAVKTELKTKIRNIEIGDDKGSNADFSLALHETYLYYKSLDALNGQKTADKYDERSFTGTKYNGPAGNSCAGNHVIFIGNGAPQGGENNTAEKLLKALGGNTTKITYPTKVVQKSDQDNWVDEYARFLRTVDLDPSMPEAQNITTHTIAVTGASSDGLFPNLMRGVATQGGGSYHEASDPETLVEALLETFSKIQAVNTVFASASLPVSVNTQGVYRNQVFIGMFRPDGSTAPRWDGNLKQYQFRLFDDGSLKLADKENNVAINPATGFIAPCAVSFWTPDSTATDSYWGFRAEQGLYENPCPTVSGAAASNTPDGDIVEKGAAGYQLRAVSPSARTVFTCSGACSSVSEPPDFSTANTAISATAIGAADDEERTALINWVRGQDLQDEDLDGDFDEMRPSAHGDVVHSRPLAVDYGGSTGVVVFYGGNDGMLRAIDGNQADGDGTEYWSFVAPEHYDKLKRLYLNSPDVSYPSSAGTPGTERKDYFFDGPISGYRKDSDVWIYATMRRGGRSIYAFDVSDPASPLIKWRHGCPNNADDEDCTTGFAGIGQTWSEARLFNAYGYRADDTSAKPLVIFGGGYDSCEDDEPNTCSTSSKGRRVYIVDADTGELKKTFETTRSVAADITVVDRDGNGFADYAYAVDTGGNIYRVTIGNLAPEDWSITKIASLGCDPDSGDCTYGKLNRKFLHAPEVVATNNFHSVLVGSGDREHPLLSNDAFTVANAFFMIKDVPWNDTNLSEEEEACGAAVICTESLLEIPPDGANPELADLRLNKGWYMPFGGEGHVGEQVVTSAVVVGGVTYFSTHMPTATNACSANLGVSRAYSVRFLDASTPFGNTRYDIFPGGGLPPSPVAGVVEVSKPGGDGTVRLPFVIGGRQPEGESSPLESQNPAVNVLPDRKRTHWYIEQ